MGIFDKIIAKIRVTKRGQNESENQLPENGKKAEGNLSPEGSTESGMGAVIDGYLRDILKGGDPQYILGGLTEGPLKETKRRMDQIEGFHEVANANRYINLVFEGKDASSLARSVSPEVLNEVDAILSQEKEELIPHQWRGLGAETVEFLWNEVVYTDPIKTLIESKRRETAIKYLKYKESYQKETKKLEDEKNRLKTARSVIQSHIGVEDSSETILELDVSDLQSIEYFAKNNNKLESKKTYEQSLDKALEKLAGKDGIVEIKEGVPTIVVSDLHARKDFLYNLLALEIKSSGKNVLELLKSGDINIVCVGDGMHSEVAENWTTTGVHYDLNKYIAKGGKSKDKLEEYKKLIERAGGKNYESMSPLEINKAKKDSDALSLYKSIELDIRDDLIEEEMSRSLGLMRMVMELKSKFSESFYYTRGNHDDIAEKLKGFEKFDGESARVKQWTIEKFGEDFLNKYAKFESSLPLVARGKNFVISHAAPADILTEEQIRQKDRNTAIALTWTNNLTGGTDEETIRQTLKNLGLNENDAQWFGGHRGVEDNVLARVQFNDVFVQINHALKQLIAVIPPSGRKFDPKKDAYDLLRYSS